MFENEDGIRLVPKGEAGVCVRVKNRSHCRRVAVALGSEGWEALDEELSATASGNGRVMFILVAWAHIIYIPTHRDKRSYTSVSR